MDGEPGALQSMGLLKELDITGYYFYTFIAITPKSKNTRKNKYQCRDD